LRALDAGQEKDFLLGGISQQDEVSLILRLGQRLGVGVDDDKSLLFGVQLLRQDLANAPEAAQHDVALQLLDGAGRTTEADGAINLTFHDHLDEASQGKHRG
jgi:hypothetical protein